MSETNPYDSPIANMGVYDVQDYGDEVKFFSFSGRLGRVRFICYYLLAYLLVVMASMVVGMLVGLSRSVSTLWDGVFIVLFIPFFVILLSFVVRRLHDFDWSGWSVLLFLIPVVNFIFMLVLLFMPGTAGNNRFGSRNPPNKPWMVVVASIIPAVMIIGILAAIALPAYQDYTMRAKQAEYQRMEDNRAATSRESGSRYSE